MANIAQQRIQREFREVVKSKEIAESGVQLELVNDDLMELAGQVAGPPDTPYAEGKFKLEIKIPDTYPFSPPKVRPRRQTENMKRDLEKTNGFCRSASSQKYGIPTFPV